jgi:hypothetical protein
LVLHIGGVHAADDAQQNALPATSASTVDFTELEAIEASLPRRPVHIRLVEAAKPVHPKEGIGSAVERRLGEWIDSQGGAAAFMQNIVNQWHVSASNPAVGPAQQDIERDNALMRKTHRAK